MKINPLSTPLLPSSASPAAAAAAAQPAPAKAKGFEPNDKPGFDPATPGVPARLAAGAPAPVAPPARPKDAKWQEVENLLGKTSRGREAMANLNNLNVPIEYDPKSPRPAYFDPKSGKVFVNPNMKPDEIAGYVAHEAYHAQQAKSGLSPDPKSTPQKQYVDQMVNEEIEGTVRQFETKLELRGPATAPGEDFYRSAYKHASEKALKEGKSPAEAHQAGLDNGRRMVRHLIDPSDGDRHRIGPDQFRSYREYYNREWKDIKQASINGVQD